MNSPNLMASAAALLREDFRNMTMADVERMAERMPWGTPDEVEQRIIEQADMAGANNVQIGFNRGAMPHDMFMNQIRRVAEIGRASCRERV